MDGDSIVPSHVHQQPRVFLPDVQRGRNVRQRPPQPGLQRVGGIRVLPHRPSRCRAIWKKNVGDRRADGVRASAGCLRNDEARPGYFEQFDFFIFLLYELSTALLKFLGLYT